MPKKRICRIATGIRPAMRLVRDDATETLLGALNLPKYGQTAASLRLVYAASRLTSIENSFDATLAHYGSNGLLAIHLRQLGMLSGPVYTFFHGYDATRFVKRYGSKVYRDLWRLGDHNFAVSEHLRSRLIELGCPGAKLSVQRMGIDPTIFKGKHRLPDPWEPTKLLSVGRLVEKKGFEFSIRAVAEYMQRNPKAQIIYEIIGDGPLKHSLEGLCGELGIAASVKLVGARDRDIVLDKMRKSHILIAPSVKASDGDEEGIPLVIMEAMAACLPVISTAHAGIPELVETGTSGILVRERDVEGIVDALTSLVAHPDVWMSFGSHARSRIIESFNLEHQNRHLGFTLEHLSKRDRLKQTR